MRRKRSMWLAGALALVCAAPAEAQTSAPEVLDPALTVKEAATGLAQPTSIAFLGHRDMLVLEKESGQVKRVRAGVTTTVLDLEVNSASERGLLGIALHPKFRRNGWVYLFWSESRTGEDSATSSPTCGCPATGSIASSGIAARWTFDRNISGSGPSRPTPDQPLRGNHDGGVIRFGRDGKLYVIVGDLGRRGQMQNLADGAVRARASPDDQFGGPEPDDAHLTGVDPAAQRRRHGPARQPVLRRRRAMGGEVGANLQKVFAYGIRNSFGMAFDPVTGDLWEQENGDDASTSSTASSPA